MSCTCNVSATKNSPEKSDLNLTKMIWTVQNHFGQSKIILDKALKSLSIFGENNWNFISKLIITLGASSY
jgi:hypothetical protein